MSSAEIILYGALAAAGLIMLVYYARSRTPARAGAKGMLSGAACLIAAHLFGGSFALPLGAFNCAVSLIFGIPGVIAMVLINFFVQGA